MTCRDCGQDTLFDGVCTSCSDERFDDYPRLREIVRQLKLWRKELGDNPLINTIDEILDRNYDKPLEKSVKQ